MHARTPTNPNPNLGSIYIVYVLYFRYRKNLYELGRNFANFYFSKSFARTTLYETERVIVIWHIEQTIYGFHPSS